MHPTTVTISNAAAIMTTNFPTGRNNSAGRCSVIGFDATVRPPCSGCCQYMENSDRPCRPHRERQRDREVRSEIGLVSGTAQVSHLTALINRHRHDLDSVPIRGSSICDVTLGHRSWNELSDLTFENIEEAGSPISSERSEENGTLAEHRITQTVEARAIVRRMIGINYPLSGSAPYHKNSHSPRTSPEDRQSTQLVQARTRGRQIVDMPEPT